MAPRFGFEAVCIPPPERRKKCRQCGKVLRFDTYSVESETQPEIGSVLKDHGNGYVLKVHGITKRKKMFWRRAGLYQWECWTGRYGYGGYDHFCTLSCGFKFAVKILDRGR